MRQIYANPDDDLSLLVEWDSPTETNGAGILSYIVELSHSSTAWSEPYLNVTVLVENAAETAASIRMGGKLSLSSSFPMLGVRCYTISPFSCQ